MTSRKQLALSLVLIGCFGCEYTVERERPETRVMQNLGGCPEEDTVADEERGVDADRTAWRRVDQAPLCYYRATEDDSSRFRRCDGTETSSFDDVRASAETYFALTEAGVPKRTGGITKCTADEGMIIVVPADGEMCAEEAPDLAKWKRGGVDVGDLIRVDIRPPVRICDYEVTYEVTRRPFSCGGAKMGFAP